MTTAVIESLTVELSKEPFNPVTAFELAEEYLSRDQLASAVAFYTRCLEYGHTTHPEHAYASLLRIADCFDVQQNRQWAVTNAILQAIAYASHRPEAWFYLSRYYERQQQWQESYTYAQVGINVFEEYGSGDPLPVTTGYLGEFVLRFQKAVAGWWIGRKDESKQIFSALLNEAIPENYRSTITYNMERL